VWLRDVKRRWGAAIGGLWSCEWKELEGGGMWAANRACELAVPTRQPGNGDCVLLAQEGRGGVKA
jgi:hypothetical protein